MKNYANFILVFYIGGKQKRHSGKINYELDLSFSHSKSRKKYTLKRCNEES